MPLRQAFRQRSLLRQHDRRRHQRVKVNLLGRFMLEDRHEYPCQTADMSPGSIALTTPVTGRIGERVVAYIDHIGRIEGTIVRIVDGGFAMTINATLRKKDKLAAKLTWLANRHELSLPEDRRHDRVMPSNPFLTVTCPTVVNIAPASSTCPSPAPLLASRSSRRSAPRSCSGASGRR